MKWTGTSHGDGPLAELRAASHETVGRYGTWGNR